MPHLQYLKLPLQFKSKITEHLYTKRELVDSAARRPSPIVASFRIFIAVLIVSSYLMCDFSQFSENPRV